MSKDSNILIKKISIRMSRFNLKPQTQNILSLIFIVTVVSCAWLYQPTSTAPVRSPYIEAERNRIDARLFSELIVRNNSWPTIGKTWGAREEFIKSKASDGYELAELMLRLFDFSGSHPPENKFDPDAYKRLKSLAEQGDASSQCLYVLAAQRWKKFSVNSYQAKHYVDLAAEQNQPLCLMYKAVKLFDQGAGELARELYEKSARLGNNISQSSLILKRISGGLGYSKNIGKAICWYQIATKPEFDTGRGRASRTIVFSTIHRLRDEGLSSYRAYSTQSWCQDFVGMEVFEPIVNKARLEVDEERRLMKRNN
jgi:hypothetical protein